MSHPFLPDCHAPEAPSAGDIHRSLLDALAAAADLAGNAPYAATVPGRSLRLTSGRAGSGQSHVLARLAALAPGRWVCVSLGASLAGEDPPTSWAELTRRMVHAWLISPTLPGAPSLTEEVAWFAGSRLVRAGLDNGTIRTRNPEESHRRLDQWRELFDPSGPESRASWFVDAVPSLVGPCAADAAKALGVDPAAFRECFTWLIDFAYPTSGGTDRLALWEDRLASAEGSDRAWKARFRVLARLASGVRPVLWIADGLEGLVTDPEATSRFATLLAETRACVPRSLTLLATNTDLWDRLFCATVPEATRDRLSETVLPMPALTLPEAESLIRARLRGSVPADAEHLGRFFAALDLKGLASRSPLFPRSILRHAGTVWLETRSMAAAAAPVVESSLSPTTARARDQLHALAEAIRLQGIPVAVPSGPAPEAPPPTLARQFQELRLRHLQAPVPSRAEGLDLTRLHRVISLVGQRFPSIRQRVPDLAAGDERNVLVWTLLNREMHFGFAPPAATGFWNRLLTAAWEDRDSAIRPRPFKVICFLPEGVETAPSADHPRIRETPWDRVIIDPELGASLGAAADLLDALPVTGAGARERAVYGFLARELDYFWRRLTRPMPEWRKSEARLLAEAIT